jgi:hypothetical protein
MSIKIEVINNALVVTDNGNEIVDTPARLVYYDIDALKEVPSRIQLRNIDDQQTVARRLPTYLLSDCIDTGDAAFTLASWKTFARTNLG